MRDERCHVTAGGKKVTNANTHFVLLPSLQPMAPSRKRKRKPLPKRPCPCCGSILSEKTIERHASGTHVPTRINVTLATAARKRTNIDIFSDPIDNISGSSSDSTERDTPDSPELNSPVPELYSPVPELKLDPQQHRLPSVDWNPAYEEEDVGSDDGQSRLLDDILKRSWSACRPQVDRYDSDSEEDGDGSESYDMEDSGSDWGGEEFFNGLGREDLIEEDFQRVIAKFCAHLFLS